MLTFRNILAIGVFLFGTTYLWLTPSFVGKAATDAVWTTAQVLAMAAIIGFAVAARKALDEKRLSDDLWMP